MRHLLGQMLTSWWRFCNISSFFFEHVYQSWDICLVEDLDVFGSKVNPHFRFIKSKIKLVLLTDFLEFYLLIESKVVTIIAPRWTKKYFFSEGEKTRLEAPPQSFFYVNIDQTGVTPTEVKNTQRTVKCRKKK